MSEKVTPEGLVELLNEHFTAMTEIVFEFEGTLDKYSGDEVMALFGAPISGETDALQAVRAAVAMQRKVEEMNKERAARELPTFRMGIGINTGQVLAGYIGSPVRMDFTVMGDGVNVASRFCSLAKAGQVVVGAMTYEQTKEIANIESMGAHALKGKDEEVPAYLVEGIK